MSEQDKTKSPSKITLKRKTHTELKVETAPGQARTVPVEVRRKRTYQKIEDNAVTPDENNLAVTAEETNIPVANAETVAQNNDVPPVDTPKETKTTEQEVTTSKTTDKVEMEAKRKAEQEAKRLEAEKLQKERQLAAKERAERELEEKKEAARAKKE